jgi:PAS domain S-box-containing protein
LVYPRPIFDNGVLVGAHNTLVDITQQRQGEEKQAMLSAIVESSDDAIISKNLDGIITSWNTGAQKIFGYTEREIIGKPIYTLIPSSLQDEEKIIIQSIKSGNRVDHFQTTRISKSGKLIPVSLTVSPIKDHTGTIIGASKIARDISDQLEKEAAIKQSARRLEILNSIGKSISERMDVSSILNKVTEATTQITGAAFGAFFYNTINENGEAFMLFALSGAPREAFEKFGMPRNTAVFHSTFSGEGVVRVDDITKDPRYGKTAPHFGMPKGHLPVVSYLAVPVRGNGNKVLGGLFFGHHKSGVFNQEHEDLVVSIASQAGIALANSQLFEEVKALNAKKDEFIALASHELKTPLTTIKGYLQVLQKNEQNKVSGLFIEKSLKQVNTLNNLISDLFDISKIEAGKLQLFYEEFDMRELLLDAIETIHYSSTTHKAIFEGSKSSIHVHADKQRIEQVISNLITNAIKYSPDADTVTITLIGSSDEVIVKVRDQGFGLSPDQQSKIFTRFYRAVNNPNISGLGLGLYLSKEIIDRHKGTIYVNSELGKGSEFFFSIPLKNTNKIAGPDG